MAAYFQDLAVPPALKPFRWDPRRWRARARKRQPYSTTIALERYLLRT